MRKSRTGAALLLFVLGQLTGLVLWVIYIGTWMRWQGGPGFLIGVITAPGMLVFPVIFWIVENQFPLNYVLLLCASLGLMALSGVLSND